MLDEILMLEAIFRVFFYTESNLILFFNLWMFCVAVEEIKNKMLGQIRCFFEC